MRVLLVDDDESIRVTLGETLWDLGHQPTICPTAEEALDACSRQPFPLVVTDLRLPGISGLELLQRLKATDAMATSDIVILTGHGDMETAIEALRSGAYDYLNKPINARELAALVDRSAEHQALLEENRTLTHHFDAKVQEATETIRRDLDQARHVLREVVGIGEVIAVSDVMQELLRELHLYHEDPSVPVLIEGETGTGKEVFARLIHYGDSGCDAPFVDVNCSAISRELFESELFGYAPGAFTGGQTSGAPGKLELAGKGTLLLDEIGEMPLHLQPKLLRVLQERTFYRVGGARKQPFDARIVCATNRNLEAMVAQGEFRADLFHRLNLGHIRIPPLRQRPEEILPMAEHFLRRACRQRRKDIKGFTPEAAKLLQNHDWPGNVRQLENAIERAVLTTKADVLTRERFSFLATPSTTELPAVPASPSVDPASLQLPDNGLDVETLVDNIVLKALQRFNGNKSAAAEFLGLSRHALRRRLDKIEEKQ